MAATWQFWDLRPNRGRLDQAPAVCAQFPLCMTIGIPAEKNSHGTSRNARCARWAARRGAAGLANKADRCVLLGYRGLARNSISDRNRGGQHSRFGIFETDISACQTPPCTHKTLQYSVHTDRDHYQAFSAVLPRLAAEWPPEFQPTQNVVLRTTRSFVCTLTWVSHTLW